VAAPTDLEVQQELRRRAVEAAWRRGRLGYKLHATQRKIADRLDAVKSRKFFLLCSRRLGKTHLLMTRAFEMALRKPNARVLYLAPFASDAASIATDIASRVIEGCPPDIAPEYLQQIKEFRLKGVNGEHAKQLRGGAADLIILDECGIMDNLTSVINDVCMPMTLTTNGTILLATTPAMSPSHESTGIYEQLAGRNAAVKFTILDAPETHIPREAKLEYLIAAGEKEEDVLDIIEGRKYPKSTTARREYFCEFVTDSERAVCPEFDFAAEREIVRTYPRPAHYDTYVSMDPGFADRTGILYGFYDFTHAKLVIEAESLLSQANTSDIAEEIKYQERRLWGDREAYLRVSDVDLRLIADLRSMHSLAFAPTRKEDSLGAINLMRNMVQFREIVISPTCVHLIRQLHNATWNIQKTDFDQGGKEDGHFDLVAALKYMCRNVRKTRNPYPAGYYGVGGPGGPPSGTFVSPKGYSRPSLGLLDDTPLGRRLAGIKKTR
jgi:hypothetical protein